MFQLRRGLHLPMRWCGLSGHDLRGAGSSRYVSAAATVNSRTVVRVLDDDAWLLSHALPRGNQE